MSPEAVPSQDKFIAVSDDLHMSAPDQIVLRRGLVEITRQSMLLRTPDSFSAELKGIPLKGRMPLGFAESGGKYLRMDYVATKDQNNDPGDASVELRLIGSADRRKQPQRSRHQKINNGLRFLSEQQSVDFGPHKQFLIIPSGESQPTGTRSCADLWYDLDLMIPDAGRFSALIDPRTDHAFDYIALRTADFLRRRSKSQETTRTYIARDYTVSQIEVTPRDRADPHIIEYIGEIGSRLVVEQSGKITTLTLSSTAPVELGEGMVYEHLSYKCQPNNEDPEGGQFTLSLFSSVVNRNKLNEYLKTTKKNISVSHIAELAIASHRNELPTTR